MNVKDIMSSPVYLITSNEPISRARNLMLKHSISRLVVIESDMTKEASSRSPDVICVGVVTKTDISERLDQAEPKWRRRPIGNIPISMVMSSDPLTIYPDATPGQAAEILLENNISGLPVVRSKTDKNLVGIITKHDLIRYYSTLDDTTVVNDIMEQFSVTVHRHHSISHVIHEMKSNEVDRTIVVDDSNEPVGTITRTDLALNRMTNPEGELPSKNVKMARKNHTGGEKVLRSVKEVSMVAEDIMSAPLITLSKNSSVTDAAKIMVDQRINGILIVDDEITGIVYAKNIIQAIIAR
ncbi:MAG TPA: CBS domain-containing protein [Methanosarcinales archaeon]|nr:CBS domain-containing protein [Methanosarcinales archaeon]